MRMRDTYKLLAMVLLLGFITPCLGQSKPQPTRAMLYSALLPGGGQVYNRAWVKAGLVVGVQGWLIGSAIYNDNKKDEFHNLASSAAQSNDQLYYKAMETQYRNRFNNDIWWIGITAALSMVDAYVDAHLSDFEEQEKKLRLRFSETGLSLQYRF
ncbi:MAG TPA: DUF5683 domain-containing protein [Candidatus Cloacimonadota bacterium]|nr:DUF5683 domain-containing protein [Candidatus Cloacimonadota bacterium]